MNSRRRKIIAAVCLIVIALIGVGVFAYFHSDYKKNADLKNELEQKQEQVETIYSEDYQNEVEERLETAKATGEYTQETMLMEPNPYGTNTLSLYVYFKTEDKAKVSYTVSVEDEDIADFSATPIQETEYGTEHEFQVLGLVPDMENELTFEIHTNKRKLITVRYQYTIGSLAGDEEPELEILDEAEPEEDEETIELTDGLFAILGNDSDSLDFMYYYDNQGTIRAEIPIIGYRSHRLLFDDNYMYYSISENQMAAVTPLGKVEKVYDLGTYSLHHDYAFDDDGNLLILATDTTSDAVEDRIVRLNVTTGEVTEVLDLEDLFQSYKMICTPDEDGELDWMHINTLQWLGDESVILSSRETSTIIKIDDIYSNPMIEYMIGEESFWEGTGYEKYLLEKDESEGKFSNTGGQHSVTYLEDDSLKEGQYYLLLFDNNLGRSTTREDYDWTQIDGIETSIPDGEISYYYKYLVDEKAGSYRLVESFEVPYSPFVSSAQEYKDHIIVDSGGKGIFAEYDLDGNLLRQYQMKVSSSFIYRVYKYDFNGFYFYDETIEQKAEE